MNRVEGSDCSEPFATRKSTNQTMIPRQPWLIVPFENISQGIRIREYTQRRVELKMLCMWSCCPQNSAFL